MLSPRLAAETDTLSDVSLFRGETRGPRSLMGRSGPDVDGKLLLRSRWCTLVGPSWLVHYDDNTRAVLHLLDSHLCARPGVIRVIPGIVPLE